MALVLTIHHFDVRSTKADGGRACSKIKAVKEELKNKVKETLRISRGTTQLQKTSRFLKLTFLYELFV